MKARNPLHTIVFAPIAIREGMAGAKRLGNLAAYLKKDYRVINLYQSRKPINAVNAGVEFRSYQVKFEEMFELGRIRKQHRGQQLFYFHYGYPSVKNMLSLLFAWMLGYRIYLDIVEDYRTLVRHKRGFAKRMNIHFSLWLLRHSSAFVRGYIVISEHLRHMLEQMFPRKEKILLLPISIDRHQFIGAHTGEPDRISFFYGGSFAPKDDFGVLLQSFVNVYDKFPGRVGRLFLSGKCPEGKRREILKWAGADRSRAIEFLGYLDDEEYYCFIRRAFILVMPRNNSDFANTGFPFKLGEYMATGNCVISARLPAIVDMIGEDTLLYYTPESVDSLTAAFSFAVIEPEACKLLAERAKNIAFEKFDAQKHVHILNEFLMNP